jgi:L-ascorbate metabolism protein UlaG (beta-lactamase superfamily)
MRLRKVGHACVRLEHGGATLVIDPGSFSAPDALDDAHAVLITHEHVDHVVPDQVRAAAQRNPDLRIWTNPTVADLLAGAGAQVEAVADGDRFRAADTFDVLVRGEWHALIHSDIPRVRNLGYLIDALVLHPGDAFTPTRAANRHAAAAGLRTLVQDRRGDRLCPGSQPASVRADP